jgi:thiol-disulfide isomerase/thioredoxin
MRQLWLLCLALLSWPAISAPIVPHLGEDGHSEYEVYSFSTAHSAFAIAPGGAFGWTAEKVSQDDAEAEATARCQANTKQKCVLYALDGKVVFDAVTWPRLWGPYLSSEQARLAATGRSIGQRFPDLAFASPEGKSGNVSNLRGRVVILHFWGSWCGPCRREMPDMQKLYEKIRGRSDIALVLLQVREKFDVSQRWARAQGIKLPLFDSGATGEMDNRLKLVSGTTVFDRDLAANFPTTYVLDRNGVVVFSKVGPVAHWPEYLAFLNDAAARSGK